MVFLSQDGDATWLQGMRLNNYRSYGIFIIGWQCYMNPNIYNRFNVEEKDDAHTILCVALFNGNIPRDWLFSTYKRIVRIAAHYLHVCCNEVVQQQRDNKRRNEKGEALQLLNT